LQKLTDAAWVGADVLEKTAIRRISRPRRRIITGIGLRLRERFQNAGPVR